MFHRRSNSQVTDRLSLIYDLIGRNLGSRTDLSLFTQKSSIKEVYEILHKASLQDFKTAFQTKKLL